MLYFFTLFNAFFCSSLQKGIRIFRLGTTNDQFKRYFNCNVVKHIVWERQRKATACFCFVYVFDRTKQFKFVWFIKFIPFVFKFWKFISYFLNIFYILTNLIGNEFLVERREKRFLRQQVLFFECFYQAWLQNQATRISSLHRVVLEQRSSIIYRYIFNKRYT